VSPARILAINRLSQYVIKITYIHINIMHKFYHTQQYAYKLILELHIKHAADLMISIVLWKLNATEIVRVTRRRYADVGCLKVHTSSKYTTSSNNLATAIISSQLTGSTMSLRSSTRPLLQVPCTRTVYGSRAFSSAVPANWNNLLSAVLEAFRCQLKTHLFTVAYTDR